MKKYMLAFSIFTLVFTFAFSITSMYGEAQSFQGSLSFSPNVIKNGQTYTISLTGGPASSATKIRIDNGSGQFSDFGGWISTDSTGKFSVSRTLNCASYATVTPGQLVPVGNRLLTQKVFLEYTSGANIGASSSIATLQVDCRISGGGTPSVPDPDPTINTGTSSGGKIKFIKEIIRPPKIDPNLNNDLKNILVVKDKFVIDAHCGARPNLWTVKEDGSAIISERDGCKDMHLGQTGVQFGHGNIHSRLWLNWGGSVSDFVHELLGTGIGQSALCVRPDASLPDGCADWRQTNHSVYYQMDGNGNIAPRSVSPTPQQDDNMISYGFLVLKNRLITPNGNLLGLPDWNIVRSGALLPSTTYVGFGDFMIERPAPNKTGWDVYKVASDGARMLVRTLPVKRDAQYVFDNSVWPPKLAFLERNADSTYKISVFRQTASDVILDKTIDLPSSFPIQVNFVQAASLNTYFAVWGDYVVVTYGPTYTINGSTINFTQPNSKIELWKSGQKLDEITTFTNTIKHNILYAVISQHGYLAIKTQRDDNAIYIYKLDVNASPTGPASDTGCTTGTAFSTVTGKPCVCVLNPTFPMGTKSDAVKAFQQMLKDLRFYNGRVDGTYGPLTGAADLAHCISKLFPVVTFPVITSPAPVITGITGPQTVKKNQQGVWRAQATDPNGDDLSWSIDWGDGRSTHFCKLNPPIGTGLDWSYSASHSWTEDGTYTVTVYASDCKGGEGKKTFTVKVSGTLAPQDPFMQL